MQNSIRYPGKRFSIAEYRERHRKVFDALRQGMSTASVAREIGITPRRVLAIARRGGVERVTFLEWVGRRTLLIPAKRRTKRTVVIIPSKRPNS